MSENAISPKTDTRPLLGIERLQCSYGSTKVLHGIDLRVAQSEIVTLVGRNGMGRSTLVKAIMGVVRPVQGKIMFDGQDVGKWPSHRIARAGIGYVPEGRHIFPNLTVRENLVANHRWSSGGRRWELADVYRLFPRLHERATNGGSNLSGGEQQMLAIGRALMTSPKLLVLDEATEGLAPIVRKEIWDCLRKLKEVGLAMIVIDKNLENLKSLADRHYVLSKGEIVFSGTSEELDRATTIVKDHVGV